MKKILLLFAVLSLSAMTPVTMVSAADEKKEDVYKIQALVWQSAKAIPEP